MKNIISLLITIAVTLSFTIIQTNSYAQNQDPLREFLSGYTSKYECDGTGKGLGLKFSMKYPQSWSSKEGNRPHIVRKFSNNGGIASAMLIVNTFEYEPSKNEINSFFTEESARATIPEGAHYLKSSVVTIDGEKSLVMDYLLQRERLGFLIKAKVRTYTIIYKSYFLQVQFMISQIPNENPIDLNKVFNEYEMLFNVMINSFIIISKWENHNYQNIPNKDNSIGQIKSKSNVYHCKTGFNMYKLKGIGQICIPDNMRLQSLKPSEVNKINEELRKMSIITVEASNLITFQCIKNAYNSKYSNDATIIIQTFNDVPGRFMKLSEKFDYSVSELNEIESQFKSQFGKMGMSKWNWLKIITINDVDAMVCSYIREPNVYVETYYFQNNDRMYTITLSYAKEYASTWAALFSNVVKSFFITIER